MRDRKNNGIQKTDRSLPVSFYAIVKEHLMKRLFCLPIVVLLLALTACTGSTHTLNASYTGSIQSTDGAVNYTAALTADGDTLTLCMTSPESVDGLTYEFRDGELHTSLNGLDTVTPIENLPPSSLPALLHALFSRCDTAKLQRTDNGVDTFVLSVGDGDMTVTASDGVPQTLVYGDRTVYFS